MPQYPEKRNDGRHIGPDIREMVRLMLEEGYTWTRAADAVGFNRKRARRALNKPHVMTYRRNEKAKLVEDLSMRVPLKLNELMDSDNHMAALRATLALEDMANQNLGEPSRRITTGGIVIVLGNQPDALPAQAAAPVTIEHAPRRLEDTDKTE